ncbi:Ribosome maturation factor RimM [Candidatus Magnetaquicoccaceae bacterium FCR-1]|uniref:Ribosome maturation factor RimM n=1 Tax=Candidatus Magnetaquiglobus chichijimensis TaxID=3141448 RepID=A0ABQ0C6T8_9PROT
MIDSGANWVAMGRIKGAFGVRGEARVAPCFLPVARILPDTAPMRELSSDWLLTQTRWELGKAAPPEVQVTVRSGRRHGDDLLVTLENWEVREQIQTLAGMAIWLPVDQLPDPGAGRHYWFRLLGCRVVAMPDPEMEASDGSATCPPEEAGPGLPNAGAGLEREIGVVSELLGTGSNDVLVVTQPDGEERLLPVIRDVILAVDEAGKTIRVRLMPGL